MPSTSSESALGHDAIVEALRAAIAARTASEIQAELGFIAFALLPNTPPAIVLEVYRTSGSAVVNTVLRRRSDFSRALATKLREVDRAELRPSTLELITDLLESDTDEEGSP